jgi:hypothetical protein
VENTYVQGRERYYYLYRGTEKCVKFLNYIVLPIFLCVHAQKVIGLTVICYCLLLPQTLSDLNIVTVVYNVCLTTIYHMHKCYHMIVVLTIVSHPNMCKMTGQNLHSAIYPCINDFLFPSLCIIIILISWDNPLLFNH